MNKAYSVRGFLQRNLRQCSISVKSKAYPAFVRPIVEYASVIWSPYTNCDKTVLEGVQSKAAHLFTQFACNDFSTYSSVTSMLNNLKWNSLEDRRTQSTLIMLYKIIHKIVEVNFNSYLHPSGSITCGHDYQIRFRQLQARVNSYHHSFLPASICEWNSLPRKVVVSSSCLHEFTNNLSNTHIINPCTVKYWNITSCTISTHMYNI